MNSREMQACADRLEEFLSKLLRHVGRSERRRHGALYVQGLLLDGERKSIEPLAQRVPGANVQALQQKGRIAKLEKRLAKLQEPKSPPPSK